MYSRVLCSLSLLTLAIGAAHAADPLNTPRLVGMDNFRDLAGTTTAYSTAHNGTLRAGVFYRTNAVTPTNADMATLTSLNIGKVFDLRTPTRSPSRLTACRPAFATRTSTSSVRPPRGGHHQHHVPQRRRGDCHDEGDQPRIRL